MGMANGARMQWPAVFSAGQKQRFVPCTHMSRSELLQDMGAEVRIDLAIY